MHYMQSITHNFVNQKLRYISNTAWYWSATNAVCRLADWHTFLGIYHVTVTINSKALRYIIINIIKANHSVIQANQSVTSGQLECKSAVLQSAFVVHQPGMQGQTVGVSLPIPLCYLHFLHVYFYDSMTVKVHMTYKWIQNKMKGARP